MPGATTSPTSQRTRTARSPKARSRPGMPEPATPAGWSDPERSFRPDASRRRVGSGGARRVGPMDIRGGGMTIQHKIVGEGMQMIVCQLGEGQQLYAEAGKFLWKTTNVSMETRLGKGAP